MAANNTAYYENETTEIIYINVVFCNNQESTLQNIRFSWHRENDDVLVNTISKIGFKETSERYYDLYVYFATGGQFMSISCESDKNARDLILYDNGSCNPISKLIKY